VRRLSRVSAQQSSSRSLFVAPLLVEAEAPDSEPQSHYDENRDLTVLADGTPLVEAAGFAGTNTVTKSTGERDDADEAARFGVAAGTQTFTAVTGEREDDDAAVGWGGTQLDTRRIPADVEQD
jgi:hypothetical protein